MENPYLAPQSEIRTDYSPNNYGGLRRLPYICISILVFAALVAVIGVFAAKARHGTELHIIAFVVVCIAGIAAIVLGSMRLKNQGSSGLLILLVFVPFVNIYIQWRLIACQEGYALQGSLDTTGKVLTALYVLILLLSFFSRFSS